MAGEVLEITMRQMAYIAGLVLSSTLGAPSLSYIRQIK